MLQISTNGYIGFAHFSDNAHDLRVGTDTDWPRESDPALIAPYLCKLARSSILQPDINYIASFHRFRLFLSFKFVTQLLIIANL